MKFTAEKSIILENAQLAERGTPSGTPSLPVLSSLLFEADSAKNSVVIRGTDLDLGVVARFEARVETDGKICLNARMFTGILKSLPGGAVTVDVDGTTNTVKISSGKSKFSLRTISASEFPSGTKFNKKDEFIVEGAKLVDGLRRVVGATSSDSNRPVLTGVNFSVKGNDLYLAATDSYRLAVVKLAGVGQKFGEDTNLTIPGKTLDELVRFIGNKKVDVGVTVTDRNIQFSTGDVSLSTRLIEGNYPAYEKLLAVAAKRTLEVSAGALVAALKRVQIVGDASPATTARFDFVDDSTVVSCTAIDVGTADETLDVALKTIGDASIDGEADEEADEEASETAGFSIGFNSRYMVEALGVFGESDVTISMDNEIKPVLVTCADAADMRYVLMPVRL